MGGTVLGRLSTGVGRMVSMLFAFFTSHSVLETRKQDSKMGILVSLERRLYYLQYWVYFEAEARLHMNTKS